MVLWTQAPGSVLTVARRLKETLAPAGRVDECGIDFRPTERLPLKRQSDIGNIVNTTRLSCGVSVYKGAYAGSRVGS